MDPAATITERPSPVSVLDSSFDQEEFFHTSKTTNSSNVGKICCFILLGSSII